MLQIFNKGKGQDASRLVWQSDIYYRQNNGKDRIELKENKESECMVSHANHIAFLKNRS